MCHLFVCVSAAGHAGTTRANGFDWKIRASGQFLISFFPHGCFILFMKMSLFFMLMKVASQSTDVKYYLVFQSFIRGVKICVTVQYWVLSLTPPFSWACWYMIHYLCGGKDPSVDTENSRPLISAQNDQKQWGLCMAGSRTKAPKMCLFWLVTRQKPIRAGIRSFGTKMCSYASKFRLVCLQILVCVTNLILNC